MNHKIRAIDLKPGMFVIVGEWLDEIDQKHEKRGSWFDPEKPIKKPVGDPLRILSVALPFVTTEILYPPPQRGVLDTRKVQFIQVDKDYVKSLIPEFGKKVRKLNDDEKARKEHPSVQRYFPGEGIWKEIIDRSKKLK